MKNTWFIVLISLFVFLISTRLFSEELIANIYSDVTPTKVISDNNGTSTIDIGHNYRVVEVKVSDKDNPCLVLEGYPKLEDRGADGGYVVVKCDRNFNN